MLKTIRFMNKVLHFLFGIFMIVIIALSIGSFLSFVVKNERKHRDLVRGVLNVPAEQVSPRTPIIIVLRPGDSFWHVWV